MDAGATTEYVNETGGLRGSLSGTPTLRRSLRVLYEGRLMAEFCVSCYGDHDPDPPDVSMEFRGWELRPPFKCMCCGVDLCARQFAFGRACALCDTGGCQTWHQAFKPERAHARPSWEGRPGTPAEETMAAFAAQSGIGAKKLDEEPVL